MQENAAQIKEYPDKSVNQPLAEALDPFGAAQAIEAAEVIAIQA